MPRKTKQTFEVAIEELEMIVNKLEAAETPLEESINLYQSGIEYAQTCHDLLNKAEEKVKLIEISKEGKIVIEEIVKPESEKGD